MTKTKKTDAAVEQVDNNDLEFKISQDEMDQLLQINDFINETKSQQNSLVSEIRSAILDSAKLKLSEWKSLRNSLSEIEELIPHIDLIIKLKTDTEI